MHTETVKIEVPSKYEETFLFLSKNYSVKDIKERFEFRKREFKLKKDLEKKYISMDEEKWLLIKWKKELDSYFNNI